MTLVLKKGSTKKWAIIFPDGKKVSFGDPKYEDYTQHHDLKRQELYLNRHRAREDWTNIHTAGFWSRWLLWNKPSLNASIKDIEHRFKVRIQTA